MLVALQQRLRELAQDLGADVRALLRRALPPGGTTGQVLGKTSNTDYQVGWSSLKHEEHASFSANGAITYLARSACTISNPTIKGAGTPSVVYAYAADGVTFSATAPTFPLSMAAGSVLRVTLSGFNTWAAWAADRT